MEPKFRARALPTPSTAGRSCPTARSRTLIADRGAKTADRLRGRGRGCTRTSALSEPVEYSRTAEIDDRGVEQPQEDVDDVVLSGVNERDCNREHVRGEQPAAPAGCLPEEQRQGIGYAACSDGTAAMGLANCPVPEKTCLPFDNPMCDHISSMILAVGCSLAVRLASHGGIAGYSA